MGLFDKRKQKAAEREAEQAREPSAHEIEYRNALRLYDEAHADISYQHDLIRCYDLLTKIREDYSVINSLSSFDSELADRLIDNCATTIIFETKLKDKREYYENRKFDISEGAKILAMVFEKRGEYDNAAAVCVMATENGFPADGTKGGMRGRLARMIKKGNLSITDEMKKILEI